ncbi:MAG: gliding motility-associated C-terminal domain-containing protein, partial [Cyclobacteriaceae bacterium]
GEYRARVRDNVTGCISPAIPVVINIEDNLTFEFKPIAPTGCTDADQDGEIYLEIAINDGTNEYGAGEMRYGLPGFTDNSQYTNVGVGPGYDFNWTSSRPFNDSQLNNWVGYLDGLSSGTYTVMVTNRITNCSLTKSYFLPTDAPVVYIDTLITDAINCFPGNGSVEVRINLDSAGFSDPANYDLMLFNEFGLDFESRLYPSNTDYGSDSTFLDRIMGVGLVGNFFNNLAPGEYVLVARENVGFQCFSQPLRFEVGLDLPDPDINAAITADNSCDDTKANGGIVVTIPNLDAATTYNFTWSQGEPLVPNPSLVGNNLSDILDGTYTAEIEITGGPAGLGCVFEKTVQVGKDILERRLFTDHTDNTVCLIPGNGTAWITNATENGVAAGTFTDYINFSLLDEDLNPVANTGNGTVGTPYNTLNIGTYNLQATHDPTGCDTYPAMVVIDDMSEIPALTLDQTSANFVCDPNEAGTGAFELNITNSAGPIPPAGYSITWVRGDETSADNIGFANSLTATALQAPEEGQMFSVLVTDTDGVNNGCENTISGILRFEETIVDILAANVDKQDQTICGPNGEIMVNSVRWERESTITDITPDFSATDIEVVLMDNEMNDLAIIPDLATHTYAGLPAGIYYLKARDASIHCDYGAPVQVILIDVSNQPSIAITLDNPDFACVGGTPTGALSAIFEGGSDNDGIQANFTYEWFDVDDVTNTPIAPTALMAGNTYRVEVMDISGVDEFCVNEREFTVTNELLEILVTDVDPTDQTFCLPNGAISITEVSLDGTTYAIPDAGFAVNLVDDEENDLGAGPLFTDLGEGVYFASAIHVLTNCPSQPFQVRLDDLSTDPIPSITLDSAQYSFNTNLATWSGQLTASAEEMDGSVAPTYLYTWSDALSNGLGNTATIGQLDRGVYTVEVENDDTKCRGEAQFDLPRIALKPVPTATPTPQIICTPDGQIVIDGVFLSAGHPANDNFESYTIYLHNSPYDQANPVSIADAMPNPSFTDLGDGTYYIVAHYNYWNLTSDPIKVVIDDESQLPVITFDPLRSRMQTSCVPDVYANGALAVNVFETSGIAGSYTYQWYEGNLIDPANMLVGQTIDSLGGRRAGPYTILVENTTTYCISERTYSVQNDIVIPRLSGSSSALTNCPEDMANGTVTAMVINTMSDYQFAWYEGEVVKDTPPDYMGGALLNLPAGFYTVVATDDDLATCKSEPITLEVKDETMLPDVAVMNMFPLTYCDPTKPNAAITSTANGGVVNHDFFWYDSNDVLYTTGPTASNLSDQLYRLVVTNRTTGCAAEKTARPSVAYDIIDGPTPEVLSDRTSCIEPNGAATALVNGNRVDYYFDYFNYFTDNELIDNFFENNIIYDLDSSSYYVIATHRTSGCISPAAKFHVAAELYYPQFSIITEPSRCDEPTGYGKAVIEDLSRQYQAKWYKDGYFVSDVAETFYLPQGEYEVEVEGSDGCITTKLAEVGTDIVIYNGVSANNDGINDFFQVLCIEYFPDNNVKIFNRAGVLVYERDFYDVNDYTTRFNGLSNRGLQMGKEELPIGTYFYVVDKGDGTEAKVGYLELVR